MAEYPDVNLEKYSETSSDLERVKELEKKFVAAKEARKGTTAKWRRSEELYQGQLLKPFRLPKYKSRIEPNIVHSVVETMQSILTDRPPKVDVMPRKEEQVTKAMKAQKALEWVMEDKKLPTVVAGMKKDGLVYGNGYVKLAMVDGEVKFTVPDPYTVFVDPLATSISNASCVIFATPTYVDDVEEQYGKKVQAEGKIDEYRSFIRNEETYATSTVPELGAQDPITDAIDTDYRGGMVILKEAWYYKDGELKLATWAGNTLLQLEDSPYPFIPLVSFANYGTAHKFYGRSECEVIESLAVGAAITLSQAADNLLYHGNPAIVMSKSLAKISGNRPSDKPGQIFYTNGPHERIDRLPAGNISSSALPMAQSLIDLADMVSGVHEISRGINPTGVTASRAISQLQAASQQIIRAKERQIGIDAIIDIYKMTLSMIVNNYDKVITIRRQAEDGAGFVFEKIIPYELDADLAFSYVPGSSMPESRAARRDEAIDLLQLGLLDQSDFWRWTQEDLTKEKIEQIAQARAQQQAMIQQEIQTIQNSTDEQEIMDALLRYRQLTGGGAEDISDKPQNQ